MTGGGKVMNGEDEKGKNEWEVGKEGEGKVGEETKE